MRSPASAHDVRSRIPGIIVALFFQCVGTLLSSTNHAGRSIRWLLVAHTVAMFLFVTVATAMGLDLQSTAYIDNRNFPEISSSMSPGPLGYKSHIYTSVRSVIPNSTFQLNQWLADGLLVGYVPDLSSGCLTQLAPIALSLLYYLWHELPCDRSPLLDVPCFFGYASWTSLS